MAPCYRCYNASSSCRGAVFKRGITEEKSRESLTHNIQGLADKYREKFPEPEFAWSIPFSSPFSDVELITVMKQLSSDFDEGDFRKALKATPTPSVLYRYPVTIKNENGVKTIKEWSGAYGFTPTGFLDVLDELDRAFKRLTLELAKIAD